MSNYNMHFSPTGGTKKAADYLVAALLGEHQEIDLCRDVPPMTLSGHKVNHLFL